MLTTFRIFAARLGFAILLVGVFLAAATSQVALAEMRTMTSCNNNGNNVYINTALQFGNYESQTVNNLAGCTHLYVRLRKWLGQTKLREEFQEDTPPDGNGIAGWVKIPAQSGYVFVAQHSVQRRIDGQLPTPLQTSWTSDNGTHSNGSWFCWGVGSGNPGGGCVSP